MAIEGTTRLVVIGHNNKLFRAWFDIVSCNYPRDVHDIQEFTLGIKLDKMLSEAFGILLIDMM